MSVNRSVVRSVARPIVNPVISAIRRYFTTLAASGSQHYTIPQVLSGNSITMDVYPTNGNTGLPSGAPAVTDNVLQTITFTLTGNMDFIGREGANFFDGIIANVLVDGRIYKLDENFSTTTVAADSSGNNQHGTAVNISASEFFTQQSNGDWLGVNVWALGDSVSSGAEGAFNTILNSGNVLISGAVYRVSALAEGITSGNMQFRIGTASTPQISTDGPFTDDQTAIGTNLLTRVGSVQSNAGASFTEQSVKRLLEVA